jgi:cytoskeletal protein CcmA (bactofilin family)
MWFTNKKPPPIRSLVGEGTVVKGELHFVEGLRIDGEVHGDVIADGDERSILVISEKALVQGKVMASHVIINGRVRGPVHSTELLELQPGARVEGDIRYESLEMHPGAMVDGELKPLKNGEKPALMLAASNDA